MLYLFLSAILSLVLLSDSGSERLQRFGSVTVAYSQNGVVNLLGLAHVSWASGWAGWLTVLYVYHMLKSNHAKIVKIKTTFLVLFFFRTCVCLEIQGLKQ